MWGRLVLLLAAASGAAASLAGAAAAMLPWTFVKVTAAGPAPKVVRAVAGDPVAWYGSAAQGHRVVFADVSCRTRVAAPTGERVGCVFHKPGRHVYRIDGLPVGGVVIVRAAG